MDIKPIETIYNGYKFRSRLEARWAVFFDKAGIKYEYEPQGFKAADGTMYLPDFYLPELDTHCEVKGERKEAWEELKKAYSMITWGGPIKRILILGNVPATEKRIGGLWHFPCLYWSGQADTPFCGWWFFQMFDYDEPVYGHVSRADYFPPWWMDEEGEFHPFKSTELSFQAVSDAVLKAERRLKTIRPIAEKDAIENFDKDWSDDIYEFNKRVFDALEAARQARFEHGETPTINKF